MDKVGGPGGAEDTGGGRGTGRAEADDFDVVERDVVEVGGDFQTVGHLLKASAGTLGGERRVFAETFNQELVAVEECVIDGGTAEVNTCDKVRRVWLHQFWDALCHLRLARALR